MFFWARQRRRRSLSVLLVFRFGRCMDFLLALAFRLRGLCGSSAIYRRHSWLFVARGVRAVSRQVFEFVTVVTFFFVQGLAFLAIAFWAFSARLLRVGLISLSFVGLVFRRVFVVGRFGISRAVIAFWLRVASFFFFFCSFWFRWDSVFSSLIIRRDFFWFNAFVSTFARVLGASFKQIIARRFLFSLWSSFDRLALLSKFKFIFILFRYEAYFFTLWLGSCFASIHFFLTSSRRWFGDSMWFFKKSWRNFQVIVRAISVFSFFFSFFFRVF